MRSREVEIYDPSAAETEKNKCVSRRPLRAGTLSMTAPAFYDVSRRN